MHLRTATPEDFDFVLDLRNYPESIKYFRRQRQLSREEYAHEWGAAFEGTHALRKVYIVCDTGNQRVGALLFELVPEHREAEVSVYIDRSQHGKGFGTRALQEGCACAFREYGLDRITAVVHRENIASRRAFEKAGFTFYDADSTFQHYDLRRSR